MKAVGTLSAFDWRLAASNAEDPMQAENPGSDGSG